MYNLSNPSIINRSITYALCAILSCNLCLTPSIASAKHDPFCRDYMQKYLKLVEKLDECLTCNDTKVGLRLAFEIKYLAEKDFNVKFDTEAIFDKFLKRYRFDKDPKQMILFKDFKDKYYYELLKYEHHIRFQQRMKALGMVGTEKEEKRDFRKIYSKEYDDYVKNTKSKSKALPTKFVKGVTYLLCSFFLFFVPHPSCKYASILMCEKGLDAIYDAFNEEEDENKYRNK